MSDSDRAIVEDLIMAILAVNLWTLEKAFTVRDGLEREGFFDLETLANWDYATAHAKLIRAGYDRGDYIVGLLVERLQDMAHRLSDGGLEQLTRLLQKKSTEELDRFLLEIKGVGPSVLTGFKTLRGSG